MVLVAVVPDPPLTNWIVVPSTVIRSAEPSVTLLTVKSNRGQVKAACVVTKRIRALPRHRSTPILIITTESDTGVKGQAKAAGATVKYVPLLGTDGALMMALFPPFTKDVLGADVPVANLMIAVFTLGIGTGSLLVHRLLAGAVSARFVPLAGMLMALFNTGYQANAAMTAMEQAIASRDELIGERDREIDHLRRTPWNRLRSLLARIRSR